MGYFNAKIDADNRRHEHVMGKQGPVRMKENGELLADFCAFSNMVIGRSIFPHKDIHKTTWRSP